MKINERVLVAGVFGALFLLILFILLIPFIFTGPASSFFVVHNHDVNDHTVVIDVFDSHNRSIVTETYELGPKSDISQKRPLRLSLPFSKGEFNFKVTVDDKIIGIYPVKIPDPYTMVNIRLYYEDYTGNMTPVSLEVVEIC
ncbi:hypothetical protein [Methanococcoides sp. LMO-2]|uniref:DUF1616 domain-containing protein n=1 Tax=Methanococcoides cohabitans TaxID=3136559 RepID=A0ABU9KRI0_9EURY